MKKIVKTVGVLFGIAARKKVKESIKLFPDGYRLVARRPIRCARNGRTGVVTVDRSARLARAGGVALTCQSMYQTCNRLWPVG